KGEVVASSRNRDSASTRTILRYHWIEGAVEIAGEAHRVRVAVVEHTDGKLYYNHNLPDQWHFQERAPAESPSKVGGATEDGAHPRSGSGAGAPAAHAGPTSSRPSEGNIGAGGDRLNIEIVDERGASAAASAGGEGPRGRITLRDSQRIIELFASADPAALLHEMGHLWLDQLARFAAREGVPQAIADDLGTVLRWLGVARVEDIGVKEHEQWARGVEAYFMEGRAPSSALARIFETFKRWL